jgi:hypothetical protein
MIVVVVVWALLVEGTFHVHGNSRLSQTRTGAIYTMDMVSK